MSSSVPVHSWRRVTSMFLLCLCAGSRPAIAQSTQEIDALKSDLARMSAKLNELESRSPARMRLADVSVDGLLAVGTSSADNETLEGLQGGGHDPNRRGFTLQQAELSVAGVVDPYLTGEAHVVFLEDGVELEEAFVTSTSLPGGLQLKAGQFLTEFGRMNPTHPHAWKWMDQPVIVGRLLGPDGTRSPGLRLSWLTPLPWYSQFYVAAQNADHETAASFLGESGHHHGDATAAESFEETVGGWPRSERQADNLDDLMFSARWENAGDLSDTINGLLGVSLLTGPNGGGADTQSRLYGADVTFKWKPVRNERGWPFVQWQTEVMKRDFETDASTVETEEGPFAFAAETLTDWGFYSQLLWGFTPGWSAGLRVDYATGSGEGAEARSDDAGRDDRTRISPLLAWQPSEFSRLRLQYNYDEADHLEDGHAHTVWMGLEFLYGAHPAHKY